jgi:hypothetical protein
VWTEGLAVWPLLTLLRQLIDALAQVLNRPVVIKNGLYSIRIHMLDGVKDRDSGVLVPTRSCAR